jgi:hypothetical protein
VYQQTFNAGAELIPVSLTVTVSSALQTATVASVAPSVTAGA